MTAFYPITPLNAVELVEAAGIPDGRRVISDNAAAGLIRSYARVIETCEVSGAKARLLGAAVPVELWQRIIHEGVVDDVWTGGTVRLAAADLIGGAPAVSITGIGFAERHLQQTIAHHNGQNGKKPGPRRPTTVRAAAVEASDERGGEPITATKKPDPTAIAAGALLATVNQTMAALGMGRTKINALMNEGRLARIKIDGAVRIDVASIRAFAGLAD